MKIRYIVIATAVYFMSMIAATIAVSAVAHGRGLDGGIDPISWAVIGFYGITCWFVPIMAAAWIVKIRNERMMGVRP